MMEIFISPNDIFQENANLMVIFCEEDNPIEYSGFNKEVNQKLNGLIQNFVIEKEEFKAEFGKTYLLSAYESQEIKSDKILMVGLGKVSELTFAKFRELSQIIIKICKGIKNTKRIILKMPEIDIITKDIEYYTQAFVEGALISGYSFDKYKTKNDNTLMNSLTLYQDDKELFKIMEKGLNKGRLISQSVNFARNLVNEPASVLTPCKLAQIASSLDKIETKIYDKDQIEKMGMNAFLAVSKGSIQEPRFIHMHYKPENPRKSIAIIGKGITFDSGGLDLKPASSMLTMKDDMSGAALVVSIMSVLESLKIDIEVHGIIAACENMIGSKAYKPGDILRAKNGKTIEVDNTDAEGRLTLADALCYADDLKVDEIIDIATLTGACMVALGTIASGIMGTSKELIDRIVAISDRTGENLWELPLYRDYKDCLKSDIADMKNTGSRYGGASVAGCFLSNFVENKNWVHIDIAGTAFLDKPYKGYIKGATGVMVNTILTYLQS